jgi:(2R)-ethylmalonyl-CoA mutase
MRTYSGHSNAKASNELYRTNLKKGQTGLSIAFDLPTQIGYDPDSKQAQGEVGKVGVPVAHLGHMTELLDQIPVDQMNTSMTINATAAWLLGLYIANAINQNIDIKLLSGTTQNDIVKEYLSRGTFIFPPDHSKRLIVDMVSYTVSKVPKWNPINVCSYHLQEAGATPIQEIAFALATAIDVLDAVKESNTVTDDEFPQVVGRISFFVNSGIRFIEEICKVRAFTKMWDEICRTRYKVEDPSLRRFRYGVQVNSLGLTEAQPENNIQRIVIEMLGVTLSKYARARAVQLPAWNEALGLPRPWDQQWSLRIQQVLAYETDLLENEDIFDNSTVMEKKTNDLIDAAQSELSDILELGGAFDAIDELKARLVQSQADRVTKIETGELKVVGMNCFTETESSPLTSSEGGQEAIMRVDPKVEAELIAEIKQHRENRDAKLVKEATEALKKAAISKENIMPPTIEFALAGGTTGEWADTLREVFGEYRAPTGIQGATGRRGDELNSARERIALISQTSKRPRILVAKPGLDGHSNGAEQIAVAARDAGFEVIYQGIRLTPEQIVNSAVDEDVDIIGLSILSGSHMELIPEIMKLLSDNNASIPVVVGGIIPPEDHEPLTKIGVSAIYTPKDYEIGQIIADLVNIVEKSRS